MVILESRTVFLGSRNQMALLTYDIDLSRSWPLRNDILSHISVINGQYMAKC